MRLELGTKSFCIVALAAVVAACQGGAGSTPPPPRATPCAPPSSCMTDGTWDPALGPRPVPTAGKLDVSGSLLFPRRNTLVALDVQTRAISTVAEFPARSALSSPAVSPDRTRVALTVYTPAVERGDLGGADLYIVDIPDGSSRLLLQHSASGVWLSEPAWTADGQTIYFTRRAAIMEGTRYRGEEISIQRINADGTGEQRVVPNASSATLSADGQFLAYLAPMGGTEPLKLWVTNLDGQQARELVGAGFSQVAAPRFAPSGSRLAFSANGGPANAPVQKLSGLLERVLGVGIAEAHGVPWDIWAVNADGSGLARLTDVGEDTPVPAWAPDGSAIAFTGEVGLYLVTLATAETRLVAQEPTSGVVWGPGA
jgi:Tol biopolymer transport system component